MDIKALLGRIAKFYDRLARGPLSDAIFQHDFTSVLEAAFDLGVLVDVTVSDTGDVLLAKYVIERTAERAPIDSRNFQERAARLLLRHARTSSCELDTSTVDEIVRKLSDLAIAHWATRDEGTLLPRLLDAGMSERILQSVQDMVRDAPFLAVVHADIDKFKSINDTVGEEKGNLIIRAFADRLRGAFGGLGLVVRTGGEEFSAFLVSDNPVCFFELAEAFRLRMETDPLPVIERANTCSVGLAIYATADLPAQLGSTDRLLKDARSAERRAKIDGRNRIRLPSSSSESVLAPDGSETSRDLLRSALASRIALDDNEATIFVTPFARAVACLLAKRMSAPGLALSEVVALVGDLSSKLDVSPIQSTWSALKATSSKLEDGWPAPVTPLMPTAVWGAIVARALLSATFRQGAPLASRDELFFRVETDAREPTLWLDMRRVGEDVAISLGPVALNGAPLSAVKIGRPWYAANEEDPNALCRVSVKREQDLPDAPEVFSPCLLMPIGDAAIAQVKAIGALVAGAVEVDDRPVKGGGLPDFWQSNLGRVVRACLRNPNIDSIIAVGDEEGASQTISRLRLSQHNWNERLPDLQRRLSIGADHLVEFRKRNIKFELVPIGDTHLLEAVVAQTGADLGDPRRTSAIDLDLEAARRRLAVPPATVSNQLLLTDGLRCKTLADAYPQAIQLLRSVNDPPQTETTRRTFREFPCFKLVLTQPFQDEVPDYWLKEQSSIEEYVERNFASPDGLFGRRLASSGSTKEAVREYGVNAAVSAVKEKRPTRRIMLPIATGDELDSPLGLSMIQVLPRERDGKWHLDFQWIWRTVEVLVGFPFSAIGSIRWSEEFFKSVQTGLEEAEQVDRLELGQLTYVALSFHMFLDSGDKEIARAIVQDATK